MKRLLLLAALVLSGCREPAPAPMRPSSPPAGRPAPIPPAPTSPVPITPAAAAPMAPTPEPQMTPRPAQQPAPRAVNTEAMTAREFLRQWSSVKADERRIHDRQSREFACAAQATRSNAQPDWNAERATPQAMVARARAEYASLRSRSEALGNGGAFRNLQQSWLRYLDATLTAIDAMGAAMSNASMAQAVASKEHVAAADAAWQACAQEEARLRAWLATQP